MAEENISQEFRLKNIDETRNYFHEEIKQNKLMSRRRKKVCATINYIEHFCTLASTITGCISISTFTSLLGIPTGIASCAIGLEVCTINAAIEKYKSIIENKKKKHAKIALLAKSKSNSIEVLICKALIDSVISHNEFVLIHNVLKEYNKMKEEIKKLTIKIVHQRF